MASANPGLTPNVKLPYPKPSDPPDVPGDVEALAEAVDAWMGSQPKVWGGDVYATFDSNGAYTWTHNLGWTPKAISAHAVVSPTYATPVTIHVRSDTILATQVIFRALIPTGNFTQSVKLYVIAVG